MFQPFLLSTFQCVTPYKPCHSPSVIIYSSVPQSWHSSIHAFLWWLCVVHSYCMVMVVGAPRWHVSWLNCAAKWRRKAGGKKRVSGEERWGRDIRMSEHRAAEGEKQCSKAEGKKGCGKYVHYFERRGRWEGRLEWCRGSWRGNTRGGSCGEVLEVGRSLDIPWLLLSDKLLKKALWSQSSHFLREKHRTVKVKTRSFKQHLSGLHFPHQVWISNLRWSECGSGIWTVR